MSETDVNIKYGSKFTVDAKYPEKYAPKVELKNGKLTIVQKDSVKTAASVDGFKLDIEIPENTNLDSLKIEVSAGDIDIKDVKVKEFTIEANAGDIDINNIKADKVTISANAGDINLMESTVKTADVSVNAGDIDITGDYDKIDCECDFGDVDINAPNTERSNIDADCSFGSVDVKAK